MAGSYDHAVAKDGQLYVVGDLTQMLENAGDWYEFAEEAYGMIWWLATFIDSPEQAKILVETARANYKAGLDFSPGTKGHLPVEDQDDPTLRQCEAMKWYAENHGVQCQYNADGHDVHSFDEEPTD